LSSYFESKTRQGTDEFINYLFKVTKEKAHKNSKSQLKVVKFNGLHYTYSLNSINLADETEFNGLKIIS